jgi:hypothetical protein
MSRAPSWLGRVLDIGFGGCGKDLQVGFYVDEVAVVGYIPIWGFVLDGFVFGWLCWGLEGGAK